MAIRKSHGKARVELPRSSELTVTVQPTERNQGRTAAGRFAASHGLSFTRGWNLRVAEALGRDMAGEAGALGRESYTLFRALLRELPADSVGIRQLVAARARAATLAAFFARRAATVGFDTPEGAKALQHAATWDGRAERLAVTSWDIAARAAAAAPPDDLDADRFARAVAVASRPVEST